MQIRRKSTARQVIGKAQKDSLNRSIQLVNTFKKLLPASAREKVVRIYLFGSSARGEAVKSSDMDVLVIVSRRTKSLKRMISEAAYETMWQDNFSRLFTPLVMEQSHFEKLSRKGFLLAKKIRKEALPV